MKNIGVLIVLAAGVAVAVAATGRSATTDGALVGTVGPGFNISLTQNGAAVTNLAPGTYTIDVSDNSTLHDFHLFGPGGVDQATAVETTGNTTWTVTFVDGKYTFQCDVHSTTMVGHFTVGTAPPTTTTTPAPVALKATAKLTAVHRALTVSGSASRRATITVGLYKGTKRLATKTGTGTKVTFRYTARTAGKYVARVSAKAGATSAKASTSLVVK